MLRKSGSGGFNFDDVFGGGLDKFEVLLDARCVASQKVHGAFPGGTDELYKGYSYTPGQKGCPVGFIIGLCASLFTRILNIIKLHKLHRRSQHCLYAIACGS